jgi:CHAT domain-containing protein
LRQARKTVERFKEAELQDYFQNECIEIETECSDWKQLLDAQTAVLYPILLPDRLELLLERREGLVQTSIPIGQEKLHQKVISFLSPLHSHPNPEELARSRSQRTATGEAPDEEVCTPGLRGSEPQKVKASARSFLKPAQTLYRWLIKPVSSQLYGIKTLVIVPDGVLRMMPFAALHDGQQFLIEKYAVATLPSLCLSTPPVLPVGPKKVLLTGLSKSVQGFSSLPCTQYELETLKTLYDDAPQVLLNETFTLPKLESNIKQTDYSIVHIASHGQFHADLENTFILTYFDKLRMNKLEQLITLTQIGDKNQVELLTLSACETAMGDDRAALGLAGVASKAGAKTVFASLWKVDDEATPAVVIEFYRQLQKPGISKAVALQNAQKLMLTDKHYVRYQHPYYWAAFLLIGYWF